MGNTLLPEVLASDAFQITCNFNACVIGKRSFASWYKINLRNKVRHMFTKTSEVTACSGKCVKHKKVCPLDASSAPDIVCDSITNVTLQPLAFLGYLEHRKPGGFIVELSEDFHRNNINTGKPYFAEFAQKLAERGYAVRAVKLGHGDWVCQMTRTAVFLVGFGEVLGHVHAADWWMRALENSRAFCGMQGPVAIWDIVDCTESVEVLAGFDEDYL